MNTKSKNHPSTNPAEEIASWLDFFETVGSETTSPKTNDRFWKLRPEPPITASGSVDRHDEIYLSAVSSFHESYPEFVRHAREYWAISSLFEGRCWIKPGERRQSFATGRLPTSLVHYKDQLFGELPPLPNEVSAWSTINQAAEGEGLGFVGPLDARKEDLAVAAVFAMYRRFPFSDLYNSESLAEPRERTACFFQASQIAKSVEDIDGPDDTLNYAVARGILEDCREVEILILSGIGTAPMPSAASAEFLDILDYRRLDRKPTVWTTEFSSVELEKRFAPKLGKPIIHRLSHRTRVVKV